VQLTHPRGLENISDKNNEMWRDALNRYLVDRDYYDIHQWRQTMIAATTAWMKSIYEG